jgi:putative tricarboxylic transport membrane protein
MLRALPLVYLAFSLLGVGYLAGSLALPVGTVEQPGAGVFPRIVGILILCLSIPGLIGALKSRDTGQQTNESIFPQGKDLARVVAITGTILLFVLCLPLLGYGICSAFLMGSVLRLMGMNRWNKIIIIAILTAGASYGLFAVLDIPLPRGRLFP